MAQLPTWARHRRLWQCLAAIACIAMATFIVGAAWLFSRINDPSWLSRFATQRINRQIQGVASGTFHYRAPLGLEMEDVRIARHTGEPAVLQIDHAQVMLSARSLLRGRIEWTGPQVEGMQLDAATPSATDPLRSALIEALALRATGKSTSSEGFAWYESIPWSWSGMRLNHVHVSWMQGERFQEVIDASLIFAATGTLRHGEASLRASVDDITAKAERVSWDRSEEITSLRVGPLSVQGTGINAHLCADGAFNARGEIQAQSQFTFAFNADAPLWARLLTVEHSKSFTGDATLAGQWSYRNDSTDIQTAIAAAHIELDGHGLEIAKVPVQHARAVASLSDGRLVLEELRVAPSETQAVRLGGIVSLQSDVKTHALTITDHDVLLEFGSVAPGQWASFRTRLYQMGKLDGVVRATGSRCTSTFCQSLLTGNVALQGARALPRSARPVRMSVRAQLAGTRAIVKDARVTLGHAGQLQAAGSVNWGVSSMPFNAHVQAALTSFDSLAQTLGWPVTATHAAMTLNASGSVDDPIAHALLSADDLTLTKAPQLGVLGALRLPIAVDSSKVAIHRAKLIGPNGAAHLEAHVPWQQSAAMAGDLRVEGLPVPLSDDSIGYLYGSAQWLGTSRDPGVVGLMNLRSADGLRGHTVDATVLADATKKTIRLTGLAARLGHQGRLFASGEKNDKHVRLDATARNIPLLPQHQQSQAFLQSGVPLDADIHVTSNDAHTMTSVVRLRALKSFLDLSTLGNPLSSEPVEGNVRGRMTLGPLAAVAPVLSTMQPEGDVETNMKFQFVGANPVVHGALLWRQPRLFGEALRAGDISLQVSSPKQQHIALVLQAADPGALSSHADLDVTTWKAPRVSLDVQALSCSALLPPLASHGASLHLTGRADARFHAKAATRGMVHLDSMALEMGEQRLALEHPASLSFSGRHITLADTVVAGTAGRVHVKAIVNERVQASAFGRLHVDLLSLFVAPLRHARGEISFDVAAQGARAHPTIEAQLSVVRPLAIEADGLASQLQIAQGRARFVDDTLTVDRVHGMIEGGSFRAEGHLKAPRLSPQEFALQLTGLRLPVRAGPLMAESNVSLTAQGDLRTPNAIIAGDVDITEGRMIRRFDLRDLKFRSTAKKNEVPLEHRMPWLKHIALDVHAKIVGDLMFVSMRGVLQ